MQPPLGDEAVVCEGEAGFAEGYDLGVGGGVAVAEDSVLAAADDFVVVDDDCAYGDFACGFGGAGLRRWRRGGRRGQSMHWSSRTCGCCFGAEEARYLFGECHERWTTLSELLFVQHELLDPKLFQQRSVFASP